MCFQRRQALCAHLAMLETRRIGQVHRHWNFHSRTTNEITSSHPQSGFIFGSLKVMITMRYGTIVASSAHNNVSNQTVQLQVRIQGARQRCCIICCQMNHDSENGNHTRKGYKTSFECDICHVSLCRAARWSDDESCFEIFHRKRKLPDPCKRSHHLKSTKSNENRAPPPSRKRSRVLDPPNRRAPSVRLTNRHRRRSLRLQPVVKVTSRANSNLS